jgi:uncharacterized Ntn-hydrolase superfamily protein
MTLSIAGRSHDGVYFGVAIASSSPAVAARCSHARARVGAVATQNVTDPSLGPRALDHLEDGLSANDALAKVLADTPHGQWRQLIVIGHQGAPATYSGAHTLGIHAAVAGAHAAAAGNLLANVDVPAAMLAAFNASSGHLAARLLQGLRAGAAHGGEVGGLHAAGLLVVHEVSWPVVDLRVDWHASDPIAELASLWSIYAPQIDAYVLRALDPGRAPAFGVPGDP